MSFSGMRLVVDGELIDAYAFEFGHEPCDVFDQYHGAALLTTEQETQQALYEQSLREALSAQYRKVDELKDLIRDMYKQINVDDKAWRDALARERELPISSPRIISEYDPSLGTHDEAPKFLKRMHKMGIKVSE